MPGTSRPVVLVVEDEPLLRMMAVDMVEDAGFIAVAAVDADDAVSILERRTDIRIVFTDIEMPHGLEGAKLAAAIRRRWPPIELILTSGRRSEKDMDLPPGSVFFAKPYRHSQVIETMRRMAPWPSTRPCA